MPNMFDEIASGNAGEAAVAVKVVEPTEPIEPEAVAVAVEPEAIDPTPHPTKPSRELTPTRVINGVSYTRRTRSCPVSGKAVTVVEWKEFNNRTGQVNGIGETSRWADDVAFERASPPCNWSGIAVKAGDDGRAECRGTRSTDRDKIAAAAADLMLTPETIGRILELLRLDAEPVETIAGLFDAGTVSINSPALAMLRVFPRDVARLIERHVRGDWGRTGRIEDVTLDDDKRFYAGLFGRRVANAVAIERGEGIVFSDYDPFPGGTPQEDRARHAYLRQDDAIQVATLLTPGRPSVTRVTSGRAPFSF